MGGGCIHAVDGEFLDTTCFGVLAGVFEVVLPQLSVLSLTALRCRLNSLNLFCRLVTIAPYMYVYVCVLLYMCSK